MILQCDDCERLFTRDDIQTQEEWCGRMHRYIRVCPYCGSSDFREVTKFPYADCDSYGDCDLDCAHCNVARGQNHVCKNHDDCTYDCQSCVIYNKTMVQ